MNKATLTKLRNKDFDYVEIYPHASPPINLPNGPNIHIVVDDTTITITGFTAPDRYSNPEIDKEPPMVDVELNLLLDNIVRIEFLKKKKIIQAGGIIV